MRKIWKAPEVVRRIGPMTETSHLVPSFQHWRKWLIGILGFITAALLFCWWEARMPNESLSFSRDVTSKLSPSEISQKIENVSEWKSWFHDVKEVQVMDAQNHPLPKAEQKAHAGALLEIQVDPGKGAHRKFQIAARITRYEPGKALELEVLDDSSGKILKLFDHLSWKIELSEDTQNKLVVIHGTETAHTTHWRSRLFGRLAPRVLLNQLFYPNLLVLANPVTPPKAEGMF